MYDYVRQHKRATIRVGLVITFALIVIFLSVMFAGSLEKFFVQKVTVNAMLGDVKGLRKGSPVWFSGVEIGAVKSIEFSVHRRIMVKMSIQADALKYLKKDTQANILTLGLLGDKYVELTPGSIETEGLQEGDILSGKTQIEIQDVVQTSQESIAKISDFVGMLEEILVRVEKGEGTVSRFIQDPAVYDNLKDALRELTVLVSKVEGGKGTMGRIINEDDLYVDLAASAQDIKLFAQSLKKSEGTLNKLIHETVLYDRFQKASESLDAFTRKLASSKGTLNKMIEDESLYDNVNEASEKLNRVLDRIDRGEGLVGSLVTDDELSQELKSTLRELSALVKDIKENPNHYFKFSLF